MINPTRVFLKRHFPNSVFSEYIFLKQTFSQRHFLNLRHTAVSLTVREHSRAHDRQSAVVRHHHHLSRRDGCRTVRPVHSTTSAHDQGRHCNEARVLPSYRSLHITNCSAEGWNWSRFRRQEIGFGRRKYSEGIYFLDGGTYICKNNRYSNLPSDRITTDFEGTMEIRKLQWVGFESTTFGYLLRTLY